MQARPFQKTDFARCWRRTHRFRRTASKSLFRSCAANSNPVASELGEYVAAATVLSLRKRLIVRHQASTSKVILRITPTKPSRQGLPDALAILVTNLCRNLDFLGFDAI